jgi:hypothetical protein
VLRQRVREFHAQDLALYQWALQKREARRRTPG